MPRLKDIAEKLGVSAATVSLVLNHKAGISDATRARVWKALEESGYHADMPVGMSRGGISQLRLIIYKKHGRIVSDTPFFSELIEGIHREAQSCGADLVITYLSETEIEKRRADLNEQVKGEGIILLATEADGKMLSRLHDVHVPLVLLDARFPNESVNTVSIDNIQGAADATDCLIRAGHRRIGYLRSSLRIRNFAEREQGYHEALSRAGLPVDPRCQFDVEPTPDGAYRDFARLRQTLELPTAFFADNDIIALGAIKAMREAGIRVPDDVSVIGFDDMPFCAVTEPALTTMRVFKRQMGIIAVRRLLEVAQDGGEVCCSVTVNTQLISRGSVAVHREEPA